ncbi:MAG: diguanylate cyclase [Desulfobacteraceae bacterium]|nr:diguanylate cyclase [Desulfobacteraceae bacterium]
MKLLKRSPNPPDEADLQKLAERAALNQEKCDVYLRSITALLHYLQAFALDIEEIQSARFKEEVQELNEQFRDADRPKRLELDFENKKPRIESFIEHQHSYLKDREKELRDIIDLLTKALANLNVENREFYQRINQQGEKIIEISGLDDIKKIKNALKIEVEQMREIVNLKQDQEKRQIRHLASQVNSLQTELENAKAKAMTDGLTGVYNRQALDDYLEEKIERSRETGADFSILMIDIDNFKQINDKYGHVIGDRVLVALAQKCRGLIRGEDFIARYGGEEFTLLLEGASYRHAIKKAEQICATIASVRYATSESQSDDYLSLTVSIGVSQYKKGDTCQALIQRADQALYEAKHKGKNRVIGRKP